MGRDGACAPPHHEGGAYARGFDACSAAATGTRGLTISRWMPPQRVQRMVQYSDPSRPGITRMTARPPRHSGQSVRILRESGVISRGLNLVMTGSSLTRLGGLDVVGLGPAVLEAVDMVLGVSDRGVGIRPGKTDFERGEGIAVDDQRFLVRAPDPGM